MKRNIGAKDEPRRPSTLGRRRCACFETAFPCARSVASRQPSGVVPTLHICLVAQEVGLGSNPSRGTTECPLPPSGFRRQSRWWQRCKSGYRRGKRPCTQRRNGKGRNAWQRARNTLTEYIPGQWDTNQPYARPEARVSPLSSSRERGFLGCRKAVEEALLFGSVRN